MGQVWELLGFLLQLCLCLVQDGLQLAQLLLQLPPLSDQLCTGRSLHLPLSGMTESVIILLEGWVLSSQSLQVAASPITG